MNLEAQLSALFLRPSSLQRAHQAITAWAAALEAYQSLSAAFDREKEGQLHDKLLTLTV